MNGMISSACEAKRPESLEDVYGELARLRDRVGETVMGIARARIILCGPWPEECEIAVKKREPNEPAGGAVSAHACIVSEMHGLISDLMNHLSYVNEAIGSRQ